MLRAPPTPPQSQHAMLIVVIVYGVYMYINLQPTPYFVLLKFPSYLRASGWIIAKKQCFCKETF